MGFVRTDAEVAATQRVLAHPEFRDGEALAVRFLTTPEFITGVLPPGLVPASSTEVRIACTRFPSAPCGPYIGGTVRVRARLGDLEGNYVLAMYMSTDAALLFGRELFGEPKKMCTAGLEVLTDDVARAYIERDGERLVAIDATLGADTGPSTSSDTDFDYRASLSPDGSGLAGDATLLSVQMSATSATTRRGSAELTLRGTADDPFDELPVVRVLSATYTTGLSISPRVRDERPVPGDQFLPYALGRLPDWARLAGPDAGLPA